MSHSRSYEHETTILRCKDPYEQPASVSLSKLEIHTINKKVLTDKLGVIQTSEAAEVYQLSVEASNKTLAYIFYFAVTLPSPLS